MPLGLKLCESTLLRYHTICWCVIRDLTLSKQLTALQSLPSCQVDVMTVQRKAIGSKDFLAENRVKAFLSKL